MLSVPVRPELTGCIVQYAVNVAMALLGPEELGELNGFVDDDLQWDFGARCELQGSLTQDDAFDWIELSRGAIQPLGIVLVEGFIFVDDRAQ